MKLLAFFVGSRPERITEQAAAMHIYSTTARRVRREPVTDATDRGPRSEVRVGPRHEPSEIREDRRGRTLDKSMARAAGAQLTGQHRSGLIEAPATASSNPASPTAARGPNRSPRAVSPAGGMTTHGGTHEQHR